MESGTIASRVSDEMSHEMNCVWYKEGKPKSKNRRACTRLQMWASHSPGPFLGVFLITKLFVYKTNLEILYFILVSSYNKRKCRTETGEFSLDLGLLDFGASYTVVITNVSSPSALTHRFRSALPSSLSDVLPFRRHLLTLPLPWQELEHSH